jgi:signal transduction histidine kinase
MACLLAVFFVILPYARLPLRPVTAFIPVFGTAMVIINAITAALIFAQFWVARWTWLLVLACGFLFTALISIPFVLAFPEALAPSGVLGTGPQAAPWLGASWHLLSPLILIAAMLVRNGRQAPGISQRAPGLTIGLSIALVLAIVCGLTGVLVGSEAVLPRIYVDRTDLFINNIPLAMALDVIALVLLWRRGHSVLDLWLMIMCIAWLFQISLGGLFAGSRYSLGWYAGRIFELLASFTVLLLFLSEKTTLYANLARQSVQRRGARHSRQIAMDAMAASIGHEIRQPLTALIANGSAGLLQLNKAEPDLKEVHAIVSDMVAEGERIQAIIGGVRSMFKKSAHDRQMVDLNQVVRDALVTLELDIRLHRVTIKTRLAENLPRILADSGQLHQVFLNLIANALEAMGHTSDHPSVLTISSGVMGGASDIAVTVEDTGVGIADKDSGRIFEPFFSTKTTGSGVGLTICRVIAEAHGGKLEVRANKPHGTIFRVILPVTGEE